MKCARQRNEGYSTGHTPLTTVSISIKIYRKRDRDRDRHVLENTPQLMSIDLTYDTPLACVCAVLMPTVPQKLINIHFPDGGKSHGIARNCLKSRFQLVEIVTAYLRATIMEVAAG